MTKNIEIDLDGVPSEAFVLVLKPPEDDHGTLGATTRANVTIIGQIGNLNFIHHNSLFAFFAF